MAETVPPIDPDANWFRATDGPVLRGWRLVGTAKYWPAMLGLPPLTNGLEWEPIYWEKA